MKKLVLLCCLFCLQASLFGQKQSRAELFAQLRTLKSQCELISGNPLKDGDQDTVEELLEITDLELKFWDRVGVSPDYIYDLAEEGWEEYIK